MSTHHSSTKEAMASRTWWLVDATDLPLGRLSARAARLLLGKHKPTWTPSTDTGDFVVVVNCEKVALTGRKATDKLYRHHTNYPGGLKEVAAGKLRAENPVRLVEQSILGMLPKTRLGRAQGRKLKVYAGPDHPHAAQGPAVADLALRRRGAAG
jgi:large subunit ribosomal protein L13